MSDMARYIHASGYAPLAAALLEPLAPAQRSFLTQLSDQAVKSGIDYASLGQGWEHPTTRIAYRNADGDSFRKPASIDRQQKSRERLEALARTLAASTEESDAHGAMVQAFCIEIGAPSLAANATWEGVQSAINAELLWPLRSLAEGVTSMTKTFNGAPVPRAPLQAAVDTILAHVLDGSFSTWRYENPVGAQQVGSIPHNSASRVMNPAAASLAGSWLRHRLPHLPYSSPPSPPQLAGLSDQAIATWRHPFRIEHSPTLATHEDAAGASDHLVCFTEASSASQRPRLLHRGQRLVFNASSAFSPLPARPC